MTTRKDMLLFVPRMLSKKGFWRMAVTILPLLILVILIMMAVMLFMVALMAFLAIGMCLLPLGLVGALIFGPDILNGLADKFMDGIDKLMDGLDFLADRLDDGTDNMLASIFGHNDDECEWKDDYKDV